MTAPLLAALRAGTRDLHDHAEAAFVLAAPDVTRDEYAQVLAGLLAFHAPLEAALARWAPALALCGLDLAERRKAALVRQDLAALGHAPPAPPSDAPVALPTAAHALGALYVVEGATLGGQLLRRGLAPRLGLTAERGLRYFSAYGERTGPMWRAFGAAVARFDDALPPAARAGARADAVAGARAAFRAFDAVVVRPTARATARPVLAASA